MSKALTATETPVTFVAFDVGPYFFPGSKGSLGGAETQAYLIARAIAHFTSHPVTVVIRDSQVRATEVVDGVKVVTLTDRLFRIRRFVSERATVLKQFPWLQIHSFHPGLIWRVLVLAINRFWRIQTHTADSPEGYVAALREASDGIVCCKGVSDRTAGLFAAANAKGLRTVLFVASDSDLDSRYVADLSFINERGDTASLCATAVRTASVVVCQTETQQELLSRNFGRDSQLFPNAFDEVTWLAALATANRSSVNNNERYVLWIGRSDRSHKRPELLLEIANRCPQIPFLMVMNVHDELIASKIHRARPANVRIIEKLPFEEMPGCFANAAMLLSTGSRQQEGFPNVFLQAAASGIPILSLEADPGFISNVNAGTVCDGNLDRLISELQSYWSDWDRTNTAGQNGLRYVLSHHSMKETAARLEKLIYLAQTAGY